MTDYSQSESESMAIGKEPLIQDPSKMPMTHEERKAYSQDLRKVVILSIAMLLNFSAYNTTQNLITYLYGKIGYTNLGSVALFTLYGVFGFCNLFAINIIKKFPFKWIMMFSSFGYTSFTAAGIFVASCNPTNGDNTHPHIGHCSESSVYPVVIICAILCGMGASTIWISQGGFIDVLSKRCPQQRGTYFGVSWAIIQASMLLGMGIASLLLSLSNNYTLLFVVLTALGIASAFVFATLPNIRSEEQSDVIDVKKQLSQLIRVARVPELMNFYPIMALNGVIVAFYAGFLKDLIDDSSSGQSDDTVDSRITYVFLVLGFFEIVSGIITGILAQKFNQYYLTTLGTLIVEVALFLSLVTNFLENFPLCYVLGALWGFSDCYFNSLISTILSNDYNGKIEIFAVYRFTNSMSVMVTLIINLIFTNAGLPAYSFILFVFFVEIIANQTSGLLKQPLLKF